MTSGTNHLPNEKDRHTTRAGFDLPPGADVVTRLPEILAQVEADDDPDAGNRAYERLKVRTPDETELTVTVGDEWIQPNGEVVGTVTEIVERPRTARAGSNIWVRYRLPDGEATAGKDLNRALPLGEVVAQLAERSMTTSN